MNFNNLQKAIRYAAGEPVRNEAFEKAIDANPMDSNNHMVYADWLDENGEPEEAKFRRSMGQWLQDTKFGNEISAGEEPNDYQPEDTTHEMMISVNKLPIGVDVRKIPHQNEELRMGVIPYRYNSTGRYGWTKYRDMESAFRKAFEPSEG